MKFEKVKDQQELMEQLRLRAKNPNARLDEDNPWAKIACVIIKSKKS
jgi:hypothetical protein